MGGPWGDTPHMRVCLEPIGLGESGPDLGCERERGVGLGVSIKADGETGIDTDTGMAGHTAVIVV
ncbi:hypothetical protein DKT69_18940 [Micromonospora sicca]|uniref:Uncharacterized protein n=1 Tax=Micromonospora sicca TaxID=2202420 RepID=A0A317DGM7_9ACTN|nr:hypothetical protein DKT69_18940 [Micromonospora sp. 4G51]